MLQFPCPDNDKPIAERDAVLEDVWTNVPEF